MTNYLEVTNLSKSFDSFQLHNISFTLPKGYIMGLIGPNGSGKTTTIKLILNMLKCTGGTVKVMGLDNIAEEQKVKSELGVVFDTNYFSDDWKVSQVEKSISVFYPNWDSQKFADMLRKFHIAPTKKVKELSKGMQQKVQFVITVLHRPRLLIFDEPFSGFDPVNAELLKREILKLKDEGHTIIFSTHNMASVEEICDHIALINHSKVVLQGAVTDIRSRYKSNQYELMMQSSKPLQNSDTFEIVSSEVQDEQTVNYKLRKLTSISNSELLSLVGAQGEICKFTECIPSMNDIFIRTVEGKI